MINIARPNLGIEEKEAVCQVIDTGMIASGETVAAFEKKFSEYIGTSHGIATTSGTTALEVALRSLNIGRGDKVLTTAFSFIASSNSIVYTGAEPVFADIDPNTFNICPIAAEKVLEENRDIKALLIVHIFGCPCDMDEIMDLVERYDLLLIEDCSQAHGASHNGKKVGSFGDVATFSFYPTKNMTTGEGGMVLTDNLDYADKAKLLINHGMRIRYHHEMVGYNYRMTNIAAAIGLAQLDKLEPMNERRINNAKFYRDNINNERIALPEDVIGHVYHQFTIKVKDVNRNALIEHLTENEIGSAVFYPLSLTEQECYKDYAFYKQGLDQTDNIKNNVLSIPVHPLLKEDELAKIADVLNRY